MALKFTPEVRGRFLGLLEAGRTVEAAAAAVGISGHTVRAWATRGRAESGTDAADFAGRFDAIRQGEGEPSLSEADVVRLLELAARKGSVQAAKILLDRFQRAPAAPAAAPADPFDELRARRAKNG